MNNDILHEKKEFLNIRVLVEWAGQYHGEKCAYSFCTNNITRDISKVSFNQLRQDVRALSSEMLSMGCAGKHCAVIGRFSYEWVLLYFATLSIGGVLVPLDREWTQNELTETIKSADVDFVFCDEDISEKVNSVTADGGIFFMNAKENRQNVRTLTAFGHMKYSKDPSPYEDAYIDPHALALMVYTSGTTGKGKGVMLSQNAILSDITSVVPYIDFSDKTVGVLPLHHTYGSSVMLIGHAITGSEVYISSGLRYITKELKEQKPGHLVLVPLYLESFYRKILSTVNDQGKEEMLFNTIKFSNLLRKGGIDLRAKLFGAVRAAFGGELKTVITGGAPINPDIIEFFDSIGISTLNGYGITECAPIVAVNRSKNIVKGSVGHVIDIDTVKIDEPNEDGEGEILVKGANVMLGYYMNEEATKEAFDDEGYFKTGDYGKLRSDNVLYITGRKKNLIILSNGKNVYPEEIENELISTPGILEIVVYEGQSKRGLDRNEIVAEIFPDIEYCEKHGITDIKAHVKNYIDEYNKRAVSYKRITLIRIRNQEFAKNPLRKIMRYKLDTSID